MKKWNSFIMLLIIIGSVSNGVAEENKEIVTLMTHDSFAASKEILDKFERQHRVIIKILKSGDAGAVLNQAILSRNNPLADVLYGIDNTFLSRAIKADIFETYSSPLLKKIPSQFRLDPHNRALPVDFGDVCLNYDKNWFFKKNIPPPKDLDDLVKPGYKGLTVVQNPAISSPGLAFLLTTIGRYGEKGYLDFWIKLRHNDLYVTSGWADAYYGQYTRSKGGTCPIVVSYASSPPAEVYYSEENIEEAPTAAVLAPESVFRQIEFVGILKGTKKYHLACKLVDFMLGPEFQQDIPLQMWVFPVDPHIRLPDVFLKYTRKAEDPITLTPESIEKGREKWIDAWTEAVLR